MSYYDDDDDDAHDGDSYNDHSGWTYNSVQARNIYGGIHHHSADSSVDAGVYFYPGIIAALAAALFLVASSYAQIFLNLDLAIWEWFKLAGSSLLVIPVFYATERGFHGDVFSPLRLFLAVVIIVAAFVYGTDWPPTRGFAEFIGNWLVWRF
ncbi:hypothetical protein [Saccharothrix xinjiangensis]|uniref:Uncharacterized protein n=1 Tax=Saccharothrix xinjiangensis TaxID=204798 RepID=A0ABV9Y669_9PSEU